MEQEFDVVYEDLTKEQLIKKIKKLENKNSELKESMNTLTIKYENVQNILEKIKNEYDISKYLKDAKEIKSKDYKLKNEEERLSLIEDPWLFYVNNLSAEKELIINNLNSKYYFNLKQENTNLIPLNVKTWQNKKSMLIDVLNQFPNFKEFSEEWLDMDIKQLIYYLSQIIKTLNNSLFLIKNLGSKKEIDYFKYTELIVNLIEIFNKQIKLNYETEDSSSYILIIIESEEDLNILNVNDGNSRYIISLEKLI